MMEEFMGLPTFIWENIFAVINTLICGLIIAIFTSTFLKKKEERTRMAGVILEKRINSEQELLAYLEEELIKEEINIENSSKYDFEIIQLLREFGLPVPYERNLQYAVVFKSIDRFGKFFHGYEGEFQKRKLWLDKAVREHLVFMQIYFTFFNIIPLMIKKVPLPKGQELTDKEFSKISDMLLFLLGAVCDGEINSLLSKLEELIVGSVYKLDLKRPKKSIVRNRMINKDAKKIQKKFANNTIPGLYQENIFELIIHLVYTEKGIDIEALSDDEYDDFVKSSDPQTYEEIVEEFKQFKDFVEMVAKQEGVKIVHKDDLAEHQGEYGFSIRDLLTQEEPEIKTAEELFQDSSPGIDIQNSRNRKGLRKNKKS